MDLSKFPVGLLLPVSMAVALLGGIIRNYYCKKATMQRAAYLLTALTSIVSAVFLFVASGFDTSFSLYSFILAIVFGVIVMLGGVFGALALNIGPWSYTTMLTSMSTIITALSGYVIWGEDLGVFKIFGLLFMIGCLIFSVEKKADEEERKASFKWLIYVIISALLSAGVGLTQKIHQNSSHKDERMMFLIVSFAVGFISSSIMYFFYLRKEKREGGAADLLGCFDKKKEKEFAWKPVLFLALAFILMGVFGGMNHMLNLYLSGEVPSVIFFPLVNGGGLVLSVLAGTFLFREKLTLRQWIGIGFGFVSMAMLCIPI